MTRAEIQKMLAAHGDQPVRITLVDGRELVVRIKGLSDANMLIVDECEEDRNPDDLT